MHHFSQIAPRVCTLVIFIIIITDDDYYVTVFTVYSCTSAVRSSELIILGSAFDLYYSYIRDDKIAYRACMRAIIIER